MSRCHDVRGARQAIRGARDSLKEVRAALESGDCRGAYHRLLDANMSVSHCSVMAPIGPTYDRCLKQSRRLSDAVRKVKRRCVRTAPRTRRAA